MKTVLFTSILAFTLATTPLLSSETAAPGRMSAPDALRASGEADRVGAKLAAGEADQVGTKVAESGEADRIGARLA